MKGFSGEYSATSVIVLAIGYGNMCENRVSGLVWTNGAEMVKAVSFTDRLLLNALRDAMALFKRLFCRSVRENIEL